MHTFIKKITTIHIRRMDEHL